jgi:hypothetical protein
VSSLVTNPSIVQVDWNGASTAVYQNGTSVAPSGSPGAQSTKFGAIGGPSGSGAFGGIFTGYVAEVILYDRQLSANERVLVTRYLGARYGITVP